MGALQARLDVGALQPVRLLRVQPDEPLVDVRQRLSVGSEDVDDLVEDVLQALDR